MIIKDKKLKRKLDRVPDKDKNGDPIFKIADAGKDRKAPQAEAMIFAGAARSLTSAPVSQD